MGTMSDAERRSRLAIWPEGWYVAEGGVVVVVVMAADPISKVHAWIGRGLGLGGRVEIRLPPVYDGTGSEVGTLRIVGLSEALDGDRDHGFWVLEYWSGTSPRTWVRCWAFNSRLRLLSAVLDRWDRLEAAVAGGGARGDVCLALGISGI